MPRARLVPRFTLVGAFLLLIATLGCAAPPDKEMNQAQGAIDAARAAGADRYATAEVNDAVSALARSHEAVSRNDYRLALSLAIDSRERAQNAAKLAGDARVKAHGAATRLVNEAHAHVIQAFARLSEPAFANLPARTMSDARAAIDAAQRQVQESRAALAREDYGQVTALTEGVAAQIQAAFAALERAPSAPLPRRRR